MQSDDLTRRVLAYADDHEAGDLPLTTSIPGLSVMRQRAPSELKAVLYRPVFCLVLQGAKQAFIGDRAVTFGQMESAIVSVHLPTFARVVRASPREPYVALALELDMSALRELAAEATNMSGTEEGASAIAAAEADDAVLDAMGRLFGLLDKPQAIGVLKPLILREIHYWLLSAEHGAMLRTLSRADSHAARIAQAIVKIRHDYAAPLRVVDLARAIGMSASVFHDHFKAVTGTTPLQYQKQLRLMEARRLILAGEHSVSSAAFTVGYESPTQFSREYSRRFGASPRRDMASQSGTTEAELMTSGW